MPEPADATRRATVLGELIRAQREAARLSLRDLAAMTNVSNPYLSQVERGLHEPSVRVLRSIADALGLSAETLLVSAGLLDDAGDPAPSPAAGGVEEAIEADERLTPDQRQALIAVYRSYVASGEAGQARRPKRGGPSVA